MPPGVIEWGTTPKDFFEKKVAMIWTTTGNLTNVKRQRQLPVRRGDAAGEEAPGSPPAAATSTSSRRPTPAEQQAAVKFVKWMTAPERAAAVEHRHRLRRGDAGGVGHARR